MKLRQTIVVFSALLVIVVLAFTIWNVGFREKRPDSPAATYSGTLPVRPVRVCMKWYYAGTMAPYFAAYHNGIYDKYGLEVALQEGGPANPSLRAVVEGQADFGITGAEDIVRGRSRDLPLKAIAVIFRRSPVCFLSLKRAGITRPEDLKGRTVAVSYGENAEYEFRALLAKYGIQPSEVTEERFDFTYHRLQAGKVDVAPAYAMDQYLTLREEGLDLNAMFSSDYGINPYADVLFTTERVLAEDPGLVERVVAALIESWYWARDNTEQTAKLFVEALPDKRLDANRMRAVLRESLFFVLGEPECKIGHQELSRWEETVLLAVTYGKLEKRPLPVDCFTNEFVERYYLKNPQDQGTAMSPN